MSIERTTIRTPLGLRFRDAATERPVREGITVRVWPADGQGGPARGVRTRSGAWAIHGLAHLRGYERAGSVPGSKRTYIVDVRDERDRFVPEQMRVRLPPEAGETVRGIYSIVETSEDAERASDGGGRPDPACYLFPSVAREPSAGLAAVRADLRTPAGDPAAHAVLEVRHEEEVWYGLADEDGRVAVLFPYPAVELASVPTWNGDGESGANANSSSGAGGSGRAMATRAWDLSVRVRYGPADHERLPRSRRPLLTSLLGQSEGEMEVDTQRGFVQTIQATLSYGRSLTLRSTGSSHLLVRSAS